MVRIVTTGFEPGAPPVETIWAVEPPDVRVEANWDAVKVIGLLPTKKKVEFYRHVNPSGVILFLEVRESYLLYIYLFIYFAQLFNIKYSYLKQRWD